jgi:RimJ/RimL family protein N-acetyltransferase
MTFDPARPFADKPTLRGERTLLRPFEPADLDVMGEILADPEVLRLTGSVHSSEEAANQSPVLDERSRTWYETRHEQPDRLDLAVVDLTTGGCVGETVLNHWEADQLSCSFRILLGPDGRDRGLGSEVTRLTVDYAFSTTELHRLELEVYAFNPRAQRIRGRWRAPRRAPVRRRLRRHDRHVDLAARVGGARLGHRLTGNSSVRAMTRSRSSLRASLLGSAM